MGGWVDGCFVMLCMTMFINVFVCLYTFDLQVAICALHVFLQLNCKAV